MKEKPNKNKKINNVETQLAGTIKYVPYKTLCPVCGAVMSPTTPSCINCIGKTTITASNSVNYYSVSTALLNNDEVVK